MQADSAVVNGPQQWFIAVPDQHQCVAVGDDSQVGVTPRVSYAHDHAVAIADQPAPLFLGRLIGELKFNDDLRVRQLLQGQASCMSQTMRSGSACASLRVAGTHCLPQIARPSITGINA